MKFPSTAAAAPPIGLGAIVPAADAIVTACDKIALAALVEDIGLASVTEVVNLFIVETTPRFPRMAALGGPPDRLLREAHTLHGAAGAVGACRLAGIVGELEARLRVGGSVSAADIGAMVAAFDAYVGEVCEVVQLKSRAG